MLHLRKLFLGLAVLVTLALGSLQAARADQFFFDFATGNFNLTGTLFATSNNDGSYTTNSGNIFIAPNSGSFQAGTYALLPTNIFGNDNLIFPTTSPVVDSNGLAFGTLNGYQVSLYTPDPYSPSDPTPQFASDTNNNGVAGNLTLTAAPVPELSTVLGLGSFVTLGGIALLRQRKQTRGAA